MLSLFLDSVPLICMSPYPSSALSHYHSFLVSLRIGQYECSNCPFPFFFLTTPGPLLFYMNFRISLLIGIAFGDQFGEDILKMLSLPMYDYEISFQLLRYLIFLINFCGFQLTNPALSCQICLKNFIFLNIIYCKLVHQKNFNIQLYIPNIQSYTLFLYIDLVSCSLAQFTFWLWSFYIDSSGFPVQTIMPLVNKDHFISSFPIYILLYFFLILYNWQGPPVQCWSGKEGIFALFLIWGQNIQSFTHKYDSSCRFFIAAFYQIEEIPIPSFLCFFF